jgi:hypothetical protein
MEPGPLDLYQGTLTTRPQKRSLRLLHEQEPRDCLILHLESSALCLSVQNNPNDAV